MYYIIYYDLYCTAIFKRNFNNNKSFFDGFGGGEIRVTPILKIDL